MEILNKIYFMKKILEKFNPEWVTVIILLLTLIVIVIYTFYTYKLYGQSIRSNQVNLRPFLYFLVFHGCVCILSPREYWHQRELCQQVAHTVPRQMNICLFYGPVFYCQPAREIYNVVSP